MLGRAVFAAIVILILAVSSSAATRTPPICTINGRGGDDTIIGSGAANVICGHRGDDLLLGGGGHDVLRGGKGSDILNVRDGQGGDWLIGAKGFDTCIADASDVVDVTCDRVFDKSAGQDTPAVVAPGPS